MTILILFGLLFIFIFLSVPIGVSIGLSTMLTIMFATDVPLVTITQKAFESLDSFPLMAILFFTLAGILMGKGKIAERLLNLADALLGFVTGGLALVTVLASMFFSAISGSGPATVAAVGSIMIPAMKKKGYGEGFSSSITASAGAIGPIIPPSISFVVLGVAASLSIGDLFLAGVIPGVIIGVSLMIYSYFTLRKKDIPGSSNNNFEFKKVIVAFRKAIWAIITPVIILGGIYSGIFTPTESSAVAVAYALFVEIFIYREMGLKNILDSFLETLKVLGAILYMISLSIAFAYLLTIENIPTTIANNMLEISSNPIIIIIIINVFLLFVGAVIETVAAIVVLTPILFPVAAEIGLDPIHFGVIMILNLTIGYITPPMGQNLFVASAIGKTSFEKVTKSAFPQFLVLLLVLGLIIFLPKLSTFLLSFS